jgi:hypothetical protein
MISGQTLRVCPEGKPVPTYPDHCSGFDARFRNSAAWKILGINVDANKL